MINSYKLKVVFENLTFMLLIKKLETDYNGQFIKISIIYFNICYNNVNRYGKRFLSRIFADNLISILNYSTLKM